MMNTSKNLCFRSFVAGAVLAAAAAPFLFAQPAYAGSWSLTGTPTGGYSAGSWGSGLSEQSTATSMSFSDFGGLSGALPETGSFSYTGTITWVGGGTQPSTVTISETGDVYGECLYATLPANTSASDGLGDSGVTTTTTGYPGDSQTTESKGSHQNIVSVPQGGSYKFTRTFSSYAQGGYINEGYVNYSVSIQ